MILVFLGAKWKEAAPVFRLLAPTTLVFATVNPLGWLLSSLGLVKRGLKIALVLAPVMITGYALGLPYGPKGVALGYSSVMLLCVVPLVAWAVHGTPVQFRDIIQTASRPLISGIVAAAVTFAVQRFYEPLLSPLPTLVVGVTLLMSIYTVMLLYVMGQGRFYLDLVRTFTSRSAVEETAVPV
jgi:PST family polysaccharide transporter